MKLRTLLVLGAVPVSLGCSSAAPGSPSHQDSTSSATAALTIDAVPSGVACIVATMTGADTETVSSAVPAGAASATLNFGNLTPGQVTVTANAYSSACPGSAAPAWIGEPVQVAITVGSPVQIPIVLRPSPQATGTVTFSQPAIAIAAANDMSFAVLADGTVREWGFAPGNLDVSNLTPTVVAGITNATGVSAGDNFACVTRANAPIMCWGNSYDGVILGVASGTTTAPVVLPSITASQINAGADNVTVINGGTEFGIWGGGGPNAPYVTWGGAVSAVATGVGLSDPRMMSMIYTNFCMIQDDARVFCTWGSLGYIASGATMLASGWEGTNTGSGNFACAAVANGTVRCWGANTYGQLGLGTTTAPTGVAVVPNLANVVAMAMSRPWGFDTAYQAHACAATATGSVLCAGDNTYGQLGDDYAEPSSTTFTPVRGIKNVVALAAGTSHTCALDNEGAVHCWGDNDAGQLGDGTKTARMAPVTVVPW